MMIDQHISSAFDRDLEGITTLIVRMGGLVEEAIRKAALSLSQRDVEMAEEVRDGDREIDKLEASIEQAGLAHLLKVAQVVLPIGLWYDSHTQAFTFQNTADDGSAESRVVYISVPGNDDHVQFIPPSCFHFCPGDGQPLRYRPIV